jgi:hypothetical protein
MKLSREDLQAHARLLTEMAQDHGRKAISLGFTTKAMRILFPPGSYEKLKTRPTSGYMWGYRWRHMERTALPDALVAVFTAANVCENPEMGGGA